MAQNGYSVDDILEEIRRKKQGGPVSAQAEKAPEEKPVKKLEVHVEKKPAPEPEPEKPARREEETSSQVSGRIIHVDDSLKEYFGVDNKKPEKPARQTAEPKSDITEFTEKVENEYIPKDMTRHFEKIRSEMLSGDDDSEEARKSFTSVHGGFLAGDNDAGKAAPEQAAEKEQAAEEKHQPQHMAPEKEKQPDIYREYTEKRNDKIAAFVDKVAEPTNQNIHTPLTPEEEGVKLKFSDKDNRELAGELMQGMHEPDTDYDPEDFESQDQIPVIQSTLDKSYTGYVVRCGILAFLFIISSIMCLSPVIGIELPEAVAFSKESSIFPMVNLGIILLAAITCHMAVGTGLLSLLKLRAGNDSFATLSVIGASALGVLFIMDPGSMPSGGENLFFPVVVLGLLFNTIGKVLNSLRIRNNFRLLTEDRDKNALIPVHNKELAKELTGQQDDTPRFCTTAKSRFFTHFMDLSYRDDVTENVARVVVPLVFICALAVGVVAFFLTRSISDAIIGLAAVLIVSSPFSAVIAGSLPVYRSCSALNDEDSMLAGGSVAESFAETDSVLLDIEQIFPAGSIILHGIRTFAQGRIDEAILDAASVICNTRNTLESIFMNVVQGDRKLLRPVDSIIYEDGMGLSAWVNGKRVLIGNRELMINHNIDIPSHDYENKYVGSGKDILYLANSGELTAMFIISYHADREVFKSLGIMAQRGIKLVINCSDPNITAEKLANLFEFPKDHLKVLSSKYQRKCAELTEDRENAPAAAVYNGSLSSLSDLLNCCGIIRQSSLAAVLVEMLGIVIGLILVTIYLFTGNIGSLAMYIVLAFQMFWLFADLMIILLRKRI